MIKYEADVLKNIKKGKVPERTFLQFHHSFQSIEIIGDMSIFDIKKMKGDFKREYYRIRKGNYRAIFYLEKKNIYVIAMGNRKEVYIKWE